MPKTAALKALKCIGRGKQTGPAGARVTHLALSCQHKSQSANETLTRLLARPSMSINPVEFPYEKNSASPAHGVYAHSPFVLPLRLPSTAAANRKALLHVHQGRFRNARQEPTAR